ncbi:MAG: hypothetical protein HLX45_14925, partial [Bacillus sp. (in: Bacteria)]|nr:hypothetical protein [Bacillus sp. (in: firmicutes)]
CRQEAGIRGTLGGDSDVELFSQFESTDNKGVSNGDYVIDHAQDALFVVEDENGNPVEDTSGVTGPDVPAFNPGTGDYVYFSEIEKLNFTIDERNWKLDYYDEDTNNGMAIAEFVLENETVENWSELYTIHYYEGGKLYMTPETFISNMDAAIREEVTGQIDFQSYDVTAEEGFYEFYIHDDQIEQNQHEVARLFYAGDNMFLVRYTRIGEPMDDATKMKWVTSLKQVTAGQ